MGNTEESMKLGLEMYVWQIFKPNPEVETRREINFFSPHPLICIPNRGFLTFHENC